MFIKLSTLKFKFQGLTLKVLSPSIFMFRKIGLVLKEDFQVLCFKGRMENFLNDWLQDATSFSSKNY